MFKNFFKGNCPPRYERKFRGSGLLVMALVGAAVVGVTSLSLAKANSIAINSMGSNKIAMQAQQYALAKGELIRATKYTELAAQAKTNIQNSNGFQDEVVVGAESAVDSTTKKKEVTVRVYRTGETSPRSSVIVTRYNKSLDNSIPKGTILPWYGALGSIPSGFALCNGANGTPDLRDRFLVGAGYSYGLGNIGGAAFVQLVGSQIGNHYHTFGYHDGNNGGYFLTSGNWFQWPGLASPTYPGKWNGSGGGGYWSWDGGSTFSPGMNLITSLGTATAPQEAHENRPPYYAVYYIMKL